MRCSNLCAVTLAIFGILAATPARAVSVSLYCTITSQTLGGNPIRVSHDEDLIVNVDYATARLTYGYVRSEGTDFGPYSAQITDRVIAWDEPSNDESRHVTINRLSGQMTLDVRPGGRYAETVVVYSCSPRAPAEKPKF